MIKLEVNHGKHKKKQAGQKLTLPAQPQKEPKQGKSPEPVDPKTDKKKDKAKDTDKSNGKQIGKDKGKDKPNKQQKQSKEDQKAKPKGAKPQLKEVEQKKQEVDRELQTIERVKKEQQKTKMTIEGLINQYKNVAEDIFTNHGHNPEKQMLISKKLETLQKQKEMRHAKIKSIDDKIAARQESKQQRDRKKEQQKAERRKAKAKKQAERKVELIKALSQQRLEKEARFQEYLHNEYKSKVPRFQKYERQFQERQKQYEEQMQEKLQKNKRKFAPMDQEEFQAFLDEYENHKYNLIQEAEKRREEQNELIAQENEALKAKLWKGECHKKVREEQKERISKMMEAKTKLEKTRNYGTIVKEEFKPRLDLKKREHSLTISRTKGGISDADEESDEEAGRYKKVARQKYIQGVNQGLVIEKLRKSLDHSDKIKQGNAYLEHIRNLPKVKGAHSAGLTHAIDPVPEETPPLSRKKTPSTTFKQKRIQNPYYRYSLSERLPSKADDNKIRDPQVVNYLLADIKARHREMSLEQKVIKHGRYNGVLDLQDHHSSLNKKIVQSISDKLEILSRM